MEGNKEIDPACIMEPKPGEHKLQNKFCFWYMQRDQSEGRNMQVVSWADKNGQMVANTVWV